MTGFLGDMTSSELALVFLATTRAGTSTMSSSRSWKKQSWSEDGRVVPRRVDELHTHHRAFSCTGDKGEWTRCVYAEPSP